MTAHDWLVLMTTLSKYAFRDVLVDPHLNVFLRFGEVLCGLLARQVIVSELDNLEVEVAEALSLFELHFPISEMSILFHSLLHAPRFMRSKGPFSSGWMFIFERYLHFLAMALLSHSAYEAMLTRYYRQYFAAQIERRKLAEQLVASDDPRMRKLGDMMTRRHDVVAGAGPDSLMRYSPGAPPELFGRMKRRKLTDNEYARLNDMLRLENEAYDDVCKLYEAELKIAQEKGETLPPMAAWVPKLRKLSGNDSLLAVGPGREFEVFTKAHIGGVYFRGGEAEAKVGTRTSYFRFISRRDDSSIFTEYGRLQYFFNVKLGGNVLPVRGLCSPASVFDYRFQVAKVHIFDHAHYDVEVISRGPRDSIVTMDIVDTDFVVAERRFMLLAHVRSRIILGAPDARLDAPDSTRLDGRCLVIEDTSCVLPAAVDEHRLLAAGDHERHGGHRGGVHHAAAAGLGLEGDADALD